MQQIFVWRLEDVITLAMVGLGLLVWLAVAIPEIVRQALCKHDGGVNETSACQAVCRKCGKELGFIDDWRKKP